MLFADWLEEHLRTPAGHRGDARRRRAGDARGRALRSQRRATKTALGTVDAVVIGVGQSTALVPGVSRSGSTIATAMLLGMSRESAARFSFLLGIPAIAAAAAKEGVHVLRTGLSHHDLVLFVVGMLTSALVGYVTIKYFLRFLAGHRLDVFAYYRLALAAVTVVWLARS